MCCNTQDAFVLVEVRLGLLTLDGSNERLQIILCIWHSVMRLKESTTEKTPYNNQNVQNNP